MGPCNFLINGTPIPDSYLVSLMYLVTDRIFSDAREFKAAIGVAWNPSTITDPWYDGFINWFNDNFEAFELCNGGLTFTIIEQS